MEMLTGRIVVSRRGKDVGRVYVIVGESDGRLLLSDARGFNVSHPKRKNLKHVRLTNVVIDEFAELARQGRDIDRGRFVYLLSQQNEFGTGKAG